jgi:polyhydroxyalkanoate synthesis regulator phasin
VFLPAYYSKPTKGIPKSDLESSVQTSLNKANTALQSIPETVALKSDISELEKQIESLTERIAALENNT